MWHTFLTKLCRIVDMLHFSMVSSAHYHYAITNYGNSASLLHLTWRSSVSHLHASRDHLTLTGSLLQMIILLTVRYSRGSYNRHELTRVRIGNKRSHSTGVRDQKRESTSFTYCCSESSYLESECVRSFGVHPAIIYTKTSPSRWQAYCSRYSTRRF